MKRMCLVTAALLLAFAVLSCSAVGGSASGESSAGSFNIRASASIKIEPPSDPKLSSFIERVMNYMEKVRVLVEDLDNNIAQLSVLVGFKSEEVLASMQAPPPPAPQKPITEQIMDALKEQFKDVRISVSIEAAASVDNSGAAAGATITVTVSGLPPEKEGQEDLIIKAITDTLKNIETIVIDSPELIERGAKLAEEGATLIAEINPISAAADLGKINEAIDITKGTIDAIKNLAETAKAFKNLIIEISAEAGAATE